MIQEAAEETIGRECRTKNHGSIKFVKTTYREESLQRIIWLNDTEDNMIDIHNTRLDKGKRVIYLGAKKENINRI